jgi:hypothetical protein
MGSAEMPPLLTALERNYRSIIAAGGSIIAAGDRL